MDKNIKLFLKDKTFAHCEYSNNPLPPKQVSKHITWIRDKPNAGDTCVYTDMCVQEVSNNTNNIAWLIEPFDHIPHIYQWLFENESKFSQIWTHDADLIINGNNNKKFINVPFGGCWIDDYDQKIYDKRKDFSIIASEKRYHHGHKLRHSIIASASGKIDTFGGGYTYIKDKIQGLKDYRYHITIENVKRDFWFTEKLIDCFRTGTIPVYWGCPSIDHYFNTDGMIIFDDIYDLKEKLKLCTKSNYESRLDAIKDNFDRANNFILAEDWIYNNIIKDD